MDRLHITDPGFSTCSPRERYNGPVAEGRTAAALPALCRNGWISGDRMRRRKKYPKIAILFLLGSAALVGQAQQAQPPASLTGRGPILVLGPGDEVAMHVFGQPDMDTTMYVADDGAVHVPLAGPVHVGGLSPSEAAHAVEAALSKGQFLIDPHVTFTIVKSTGNKVSVLGQVRTPGIFEIEPNTTVLDLLAQAGGETEQGADTIFILRPGPGGAIRRLAVNLGSLAETGTPPEAAEITMRSGDQVYVPRAPEVYVTGDVHTPGLFRLDRGMTVFQALARAGGVTNMGSTRRIIIKRQEPDGKYREISAHLTDTLESNDVITVRERIF